MAEVEAPLEVLEREITELAAHLAVATARWLRLIAKFDRRQGSAEWGCRSCAHWLNWRWGLALGAAREKVRTARALEGVPQLGAHWANGGPTNLSKLMQLCLDGLIEFSPPPANWS